jgi:hydantoinase/carbamoylase family amidase
MDEEGTRFDASMFGSLAFVGEDLSALGTRLDADGCTLAEAMRAAGRDLATIGAAARVGEVGAYVELHIEQGPVLEAAEAQIGAVTSIVGLRGYRLRLRGESNHAGTTPMGVRRDALAGAARVALELRDTARGHEGWTANVGKLAIAPGGSNVVPGLAELTIDVRAPTAAGVAEWERVVPAIVERIAADERLEAELEQSFSLEPVELDPQLVATVAAAADACGAATVQLPSGAGHDAMVLGRHVPAAMIFVPSRGGISHSPDEHTDTADLELGVEVLAETLRRLTRMPRSAS